MTEDPCADLRAQLAAAEAVLSALRAAFVAEDAYLGAAGLAEDEEMAQHETRVAEAWRECRAAYEE